MTIYYPVQPFPQENRYTKCFERRIAFNNWKAITSGPFFNISLKPDWAQEVTQGSRLGSRAQDPEAKNLFLHPTFWLSFNVHNAGARVAAKMGAPYFWPFFHLRPLFPMENVNFFGIFFLVMVKVIIIHNWKSFTTAFHMENSIKFDHIQNYPGRTGANIMYTVHECPWNTLVCICFLLYFSLSHNSSGPAKSVDLWIIVHDWPPAHESWTLKDEGSTI